MLGKTEGFLVLFTVVCCDEKDDFQEFNFYVKYKIILLISLTSTCWIIGVIVLDIYFCIWQKWL